jgi:hypothetical protein
MRHFSCGCATEPGEYCDEHMLLACHTEPDDVSGDECPGCWLARVRSVSLSAEATPTRKGLR